MAMTQRHKDAADKANDLRERLNRRRAALTPGTHEAIIRVGGRQLFSKLSKALHKGVAERSGRIGHTAEYLKAVIETAAEFQQDDEDVRKFVKHFTSKSPVFSNTPVGMAAVQFEAWMIDEESDAFRQLIETVAEPQAPDFLAIFQGKLKAEDWDELREGCKKFVTLKILVEAGQTSDDHMKSDVTILQGIPVKNYDPSKDKDETEQQHGPLPVTDVKFPIPKAPKPPTFANTPQSIYQEHVTDVLPDHEHYTQEQNDHKIIHEWRDAQGNVLRLTIREQKDRKGTYETQSVYRDSRTHTTTLLYATENVTQEQLQDPENILPTERMQSLTNSRHYPYLRVGDNRLESRYGSWTLEKDRNKPDQVNLAIGGDDGKMKRFSLASPLSEAEGLVNSIADMYEGMTEEFDLMTEVVLREYATENATDLSESDTASQNPVVTTPDKYWGGCRDRRDFFIDKRNVIRLAMSEELSLNDYDKSSENLEEIPAVDDAASLTEFPHTSATMRRLRSRGKNRGKFGKIRSGMSRDVGPGSRGRFAEGDDDALASQGGRTKRDLVIAGWRDALGELDHDILHKGYKPDDAKEASKGDYLKWREASKAVRAKISALYDEFSPQAQALGRKVNEPGKIIIDTRLNKMRKMGPDELIAYLKTFNPVDGVQEGTDYDDTASLLEGTAQTILQQLGGKRFSVMTGASQYIDVGGGLAFRIGRNSGGVNKVKIVLDASDTYTMTFYRIRKMEVKVIATKEGLHAEDLRKVFTDVTGMKTSLGTMGKTEGADDYVPESTLARMNARTYEDVKRFGESSDWLAKMYARRSGAEAPVEPTDDAPVEPFTTENHYKFVEDKPRSQGESVVLFGKPVGYVTKCEAREDKRFTIVVKPIDADGDRVLANATTANMEESTGPKFKVGQKLIYTGKAGSMPAEFRGYHTDYSTGTNAARIIVRPESGPPFEASVDPSELRTDEASDIASQIMTEDFQYAILELSEGTATRRIGEKDADKPLRQEYDKWLRMGDAYKATGGTIEMKLESYAYKASVDMSGTPVFIRVRPQTDELYKFDNSIMGHVLEEIDKFWALKKDYEDFGFMYNRGVLLHGPPGTGKTSIVHQVAEMITERGDVVFYARDIGALTVCLNALREVEPDRKVVVILEDADEFLRYSEREFLQLLDGEQSVQNVLYLATTNYIDRFPPRLLRPGRFDEHVYVPCPPRAGRVAYLKAKLSKKLAEADVDETVDDLADKTAGMSFGHLRELFLAAYVLKQPLEKVLARLRQTAPEAPDETSKLGDRDDVSLKRSYRESVDGVTQEDIDGMPWGSVLPYALGESTFGQDLVSVMQKRGGWICSDDSKHWTHPKYEGVAVDVSDDGKQITFTGTDREMKESAEASFIQGPMTTIGDAQAKALSAVVEMEQLTEAV